MPMTASQTRVLIANTNTFEILLSNYAILYDMHMPTKSSTAKDDCSPDLPGPLFLPAYSADFSSKAWAPI